MTAADKIKAKLIDLGALSAAVHGKTFSAVWGSAIEAEAAIKWMSTMGLIGDYAVNPHTGKHHTAWTA